MLDEKDLQFTVTGDEIWGNYAQIPRVHTAILRVMLVLIGFWLALLLAGATLVRPIRAPLGGPNSIETESILLPRSLPSNGDQDELKVLIGNPSAEFQVTHVVISTRDPRVSFGSTDSSTSNFTKDLEIAPKEYQEIGVRVLTREAETDVTRQDFQINVTVDMSSASLVNQDFRIPQELPFQRQILQSFVGLNLPGFLSVMLFLIASSEPWWTSTVEKGIVLTDTILGNSISKPLWRVWQLIWYIRWLLPKWHRQAGN